jgi:hypothetical protein
LIIYAYSFHFILIDELVKGHVGDLVVLSFILKAFHNNNFNKILPIRYILNKGISLPHRISLGGDGIFDFLEGISQLS